MADVTRGGALDSNRGTQIALPGTPHAEMPLGPREAFLVAYDRLATLAAAAPSGALAIAAVEPNARVVDAFLVLDRTALVVGRHTQCGLRLPRDPVSLRHLAVLARSEEGRAFAHVWDLNTHKPFITEDGQRAGAIVADGPSYIAVGPYALWIAPASAAAAWPRSAIDTWDALPPRDFVDRRSPAAARRAAAFSPAALERTRVTTIGAPLLLGEGDSPEVRWGTLRLEVAGYKQKQLVSAERLGQGILVGRYERCGIALSEGTRMSRVHLLLVRIGTEVWAIDTASTNGVMRGDARIAATVLSDEDALTLAGSLTLEWQRDKHADA